MPRDRTGNRYEQLLEASLLHLDYTRDSDIGLNYIRPSVRGQVIIPGTFIQPDIVIRQDTSIRAILYVTHWSNRRNSNFKFWRTWEELAQQKLAIGTDFVAINCVFEALPPNSSPFDYITSDELPPDPSRDDGIPISFNGWYGAISWSLVESFDVSLIFPNSYEPCSTQLDLINGQHDVITSNLLELTLARTAKPYLTSQWQTLQTIQSQAIGNNLINLQDTQSRYRIGLLHVYLFYRLFHYLVPDGGLDLDEFVNALVSTDQNQVNLDALIQASAFAQIPRQQLIEVFSELSQVYVRKSQDAETFCTMTSLHNPIAGGSVHRIRFNQDLRLCLQDLGQHLNEPGFVDAIQRAFGRFDATLGINECFEDLASQPLVVSKENFIRQTFLTALTTGDEATLDNLLQTHAKEFSPERSAVSTHQQNWVFEMLLYLAGLTSDEDIQTKLKENFEAIAHPHLLQPHAPYGDEAKLSRYLLQGRNICGHWSSRSCRQTLTEVEFRTFSWRTVAKSVLQAFQEKGRVIRGQEEVIRRYIQTKSMRIIGADLNSFHILLEHYLGDLCAFAFDENATSNTRSQRICPSWQTDVIGKIWNGRPLETWMEGLSLNRQWMIKAQSAPSNPGDKTKELAGRCRALRLAWSHGTDPRDRSQWSFSQRPLPKLAIVLDGDWDATKKRNLYEAGWDWVGDVSQLHELRQLIQATSSI
ncbi:MULTISPECIES: hypothetical protein [Trichocoleus]|uniref:Uncharacterized protein n=1 Tax=Trichocoleus desertorum GB2-A4 TaxID=2933944 RepID=A0ABV0JCG6_9CYAN|nr:hypothetical protein [Trichocoleus sp. FACHB-46]MBD1863990.1 hypothetical protein [Trichocoleus sp. FACHB-46]